LGAIAVIFVGRLDLVSLNATASSLVKKRFPCQVSRPLDGRDETVGEDPLNIWLPIRRAGRRPTLGRERRGGLFDGARLDCAAAGTGASNATASAAARAPPTARNR